jgi:hypothetical protein
MLRGPMTQTAAKQREATNAEDRENVLEKFWEKMDMKVKNFEECKRRSPQLAHPWLRLKQPLFRSEG